MKSRQHLNSVCSGIVNVKFQLHRLRETQHNLATWQEYDITSESVLFVQAPRSHPGAAALCFLRNVDGLKEREHDGGDLNQVPRTLTLHFSP
jgi:hypothetical protein